MPSFSRYPRSFEDPIDDHVRRAVVALGEKLVGKRAVYLDTNYWIRLRDANRGRKGTQKTVDLLRLLRHGVARGTLFCPISEAVFIELMKQEDPSSRVSTAALIDDLSLGVTLIQESERIITEIEYFLYAASKRTKRYPLQYLVWSKVPYVLGLIHPTTRKLDSAANVAMQKTFFDHMWRISLQDMVALIEDPEMSDLDATSDADAAHLNEDIVRHAHELRSFEQAYTAEAKGLVDLYGGTAVDAMMSMANDDGITLKPPSVLEQQEDEKQWKNLLFFALRRNKARHALRTLHILASLYASLRWNKGRKFRDNDTLDFIHAAAALAYCDAFFTERSLCAMVTARHIALDELFKCYVTADENDAIEFVSDLVP